MNDAEYDSLKAKVKDAGISQQAFIINAISEAVIASADEIKVQKEISRSLSDLVRLLRGLATNVNQIAHVANDQGAISSLNELRSIHDEISNYRKESDEIWLSIRSSINRQKATEQ
jgi:ATP phosphoribosyltransferase regulatory subunit HisZ